MTTPAPTPSPTPAPALEPDPKLTTFVVEISQVNAPKWVRIVNGARREHVRDYLLADGTVVIRKATTHEAMALVGKGIKPETAAGGEGGAA